jgi:hypothetical protein
MTAVSACGEAPETQTVTVTKTTAAPQRHIATPTPSAPRASTPKRTKTTLTACDPNVRVKASTTTCGFAESVFYEYWRWLEYGGVDQVKAYSSALDEFLPVDCSSGDMVTCRTEAGAVVRFPQSAVAAYTLANASKYAASHEVSTSPQPKDDAPDTSTDDGNASDCDPSYEGACLNPAAADYDCEGGSGDGPEYTGTVTVVGDDHFGLDRDGDGVACEG